MKNVQIFQSINATIAQQNATSFLEKCLIENKSKEILLLLSGGSAFSLLNIDIKILTDKMTIGVLDERYSTDPNINNFQQLVATPFFLKAQRAGCRFIDTSVKPNETIAELALCFERELKNWKNNNPNGIIIITQGMGADGHTSGIMPFPENKDLFATLFENETKWVAGYDAGNRNQFPQRVTTTIPFLRNVDISLVYIVGKEKVEIVKKALKEDVSSNVLPICIIKKIKSVYLFTDITEMDEGCSSAKL